MDYATISILHCCLYDVLSLNNVMIGCTSWQLVYGIEGIDIVCLHYCVLSLPVLRPMLYTLFYVYTMCT